MALVKLRKAAQLTLPGEIRKALAVEEGDFLEASLVEGGVLLRPVTVVDREAAWRRIEAAMANVRPTPEQAAKSPEEQEAEIVEIVTEARRELSAERRRR